MRRWLSGLLVGWVILTSSLTVHAEGPGDQGVDDHLQATTLERTLAEIDGGMFDGRKYAALQGLRSYYQTTMDCLKAEGKRDREAAQQIKECAEAIAQIDQRIAVIKPPVIVEVVQLFSPQRTPDAAKERMLQREVQSLAEESSLWDAQLDAATVGCQALSQLMAVVSMDRLKPEFIEAWVESVQRWSASVELVKHQRAQLEAARQELAAFEAARTGG